MSDTVSWNVHMSVREGQLNDARELMTEMVESTRGEVGTLGYEWFLGADGTVCHLNERYADSDAAMVHLGPSTPSSLSASLGASSRPVSMCTANQATRCEQSSTILARCTLGPSVALAARGASTSEQH